MSRTTGYLIRAAICAVIAVGGGYYLIHNGSADIRTYIGIVSGICTAIGLVVLAIRDKESPEEAAERLRQEARTREILGAAKDRRHTGRYPWV